MKKVVARVAKSVSLQPANILFAGILVAKKHTMICVACDRFLIAETNITPNSALQLHN